MRLLLDEMLSAVIAQQLRNRGHDVLAVDDLSSSAVSPTTSCSSTPNATRERSSHTTATTSSRLTTAIAKRVATTHGIVILNPRRFVQGNQTIGVLATSLEAFLTADPPYAGFVHWLR